MVGFLLPLIIYLLEAGFISMFNKVQIFINIMAPTMAPIPANIPYASAKVPVIIGIMIPPTPPNSNNTPIDIGYSLINLPVLATVVG